MSSSSHPANRGRTLEPPEFALAAKDAYAMLGGSIDWRTFGDVYGMLFNNDKDIELFMACLVEYACHMYLVEKLQRGLS